MAKSTKTGLTPLELKMMQAVWKLGAGTVSAVQAELDDALAYTTVQTMLNILERKGKLKRERDGRAYVYRARVSQDNALRQGVRDLVDRMFGGSSEGLVMSLLKSGQIDSERLRALTERFNRETEER